MSDLVLAQMNPGGHEGKKNPNTGCNKTAHLGNHFLLWHQFNAQLATKMFVLQHPLSQMQMQRCGVSWLQAWKWIEKWDSQDDIINPDHPTFLEERCGKWLCFLYGGTPVLENNVIPAAKTCKTLKPHQNKKKTPKNTEKSLEWGGVAVSRMRPCACWCASAESCGLCREAGLNECEDFAQVANRRSVRKTNQKNDNHFSSFDNFLQSLVGVFWEILKIGQKMTVWKAPYVAASLPSWHLSSAAQRNLRAPKSQLGVLQNPKTMKLGGKEGLKWGK